MDMLISLRIDSELCVKLENIARQRDLTRSHLVYRILQEYVSRNDPDLTGEGAE